MSDKDVNHNCQLLDAKALARLLSTSVRSVWRYRSAGLLPEPVKIGGAIRWRLSDVELFIRMGAKNRKEFETFKDIAAVK